MRTLLMDIMLHVRRGLNLEKRHLMALNYDARGMIIMFRWADGKLYSLRIEEVKEDRSGTGREDQDSAGTPGTD